MLVSVADKYILKGEKMQQNGIIVLKIVIWGGKLLVLWLQICNHKTYDFPPHMTISSTVTS